MVETKYRQEEEVKTYYRNSERFARDCNEAENGKYFEIPAIGNKPLKLEYGKFMDFFGNIH